MGRILREFLYSFNESEYPGAWWAVYGVTRHLEGQQ